MPIERVAHEVAHEARLCHNISHRLQEGFRCADYVRTVAQAMFPFIIEVCIKLYIYEHIGNMRAAILSI